MIQREEEKRERETKSAAGEQEYYLIGEMKIRSIVSSHKHHPKWHEYENPVSSRDRSPFITQK